MVRRLLKTGKGGAMSKLAPVLLVAAGLAVGLRLGFNPHAHQQIVQNWNQARTAVVQTTAKVHLSPAPLTIIKISTTTHIQAPTASTAWRQITTAFESLVSNLQKLWLNTAARISNTR
jgi:hypothetical protein